MSSPLMRTVPLDSALRIPMRGYEAQITGGMVVSLLVTNPHEGL